MHVAYVSPVWSGHHPGYARLYGRALRELGHRASLVSPAPRPPESTEFVAWAPLEGMTAPPPGRQRRHVVVEAWQAAARAVSACGAAGVPVDVAFFAWIDTFLDPGVPGPVVDRCFGFPWVGLYVHPRFLRLPPTGLRARVAALLGRRPDGVLRAAGCRGVAVLDEGVVERLRARLPDIAVRWLPDATDAAVASVPVLATRVRELARGRPVVVLAGSLHPRKGLGMLTEALDLTPTGRWFGVVAGQPSGDAAWIDPALAHRDDLFLHLERLPEGELNALLAAADLVFAAYHSFPHSSGILIKAAHLGRRVVVADGFLMAERVRRYRMGFVVPEGDAKALAEVLELAARGRGLDAPAHAELAEQHTPARLRSALAELLSAAMRSDRVRDVADEPSATSLAR